MSNVAGLEGFVEFFRGYGDSFAVLGGAACSQWLGDANLEFRNTKDIDLVLVLEAKDRKFFERFWRYLHNGGYVKWQRSDGKADKEDGKKVRERDILKHRNDVFHLAYLVDDSVSVSLPEPIAEDLRRFLGLYPATDSRWEGIMQSLKETHYQPVEPTDLIGIIRTHFGL